MPAVLDAAVVDRRERRSTRSAVLESRKEPCAIRRERHMLTARGDCGGRRAVKRRSTVTLLGGAIVLALLVVYPGTGGTAATGGGIVRAAMRAKDVDSLDPALVYSAAGAILVDTTCARLVTQSARGAGEGVPLVPEVAAAMPRRSKDGRTYTFRLRTDVRFSDGTPVRASAFARAINRMLAPGVKSPWAPYAMDIVGADQVHAGKADAAEGLEARGSTLVVRLKRPAPDFLVRSTAFCAVPPTLPADREGIAAFPAAGPYYVADYRPGERVTIRRNPFYRGTRPQRVAGFDVDLELPSPAAVLDRVEAGTADWGWVLPIYYFDPARRLVEKYGVNRARFFVQPGSTFRGYAFNTSRPLFKNNPQLRKAVNFAIDRAALRNAGAGPLESTLTDQYLPPSMLGYRDARIYPLARPDLRRARELARGHTRSGHAVLYTVDSPEQLEFAQSVSANLAQIGLVVEIKPIPHLAYFGRLGANGPYDIGFQPWLPDYGDPVGVLNSLFDSRYIGTTNWGRFRSSTFDRLLRQAAKRAGRARYRAYGDLDVRLARDAAPSVAVDYLNDATLVSARVGCVRRPFDLSAICLQR
jgi:peptide/nickel transport system substrate-binding protein